MWLYIIGLHAYCLLCYSNSYHLKHNVVTMSLETDFSHGKMSNLRKGSYEVISVAFRNHWYIILGYFK